MTMSSLRSIGLHLGSGNAQVFTATKIFPFLTNSLMTTSGLIEPHSLTNGENLKADR